MFGGNEGGFTTNFNSPGASGDKGGSGRFKSQRLVPCTIADIFSLENDGNAFKMGDLEIAQITFVGLITNVQSSDTSVQYEITDHTTNAAISVRKWVIDDSEGDGAKQAETLEPDTYVRVCGNVKNFQNKMSVTALGIIPLEDRNEITTHILECLKFQMLKDKPKAATAAGFSGFQMDTTTSNNMGAGGNANLGMDKIQNQVFQAVETSAEDHGIHITEIQGMLKGLNKIQIKNALEFLSNEGHIYSTIDDEHFKTTS